MASQQNHSYDFDYLVIGGGSGGVSSAKRAAGYGQKVAIIEGAAWGGTCVNVGCVPKKIMLQTANIYETIQHEASHYEMSGNGTTFAWGQLKTKRDAYIQRLNKIYHNGLDKAGVTILTGWGKLTDAHTVNITTPDGGGQPLTVTAQYILLAVGGKPFVDTSVAGVEHTITSDGFFALTEQPGKVVVVGAGYIAVELAGVLHALGSDTHLVVRKGHALRTFDPDVSSFLDAAMVKAGLNIHRNTMGVKSVELLPSGKKRLTTLSGQVLDDLDCVLMAPGRVPVTEGLGLEAVGVNLNHKKEIVVDDFQNTSVPNIFALGDVCDKGMELTPMAIAAGRRLADRVFNGQTTQKTSYENVPTVVFSHPEIGTIGLTEPAAVAKYGADNLKIYKSTFVNLHYSMYNMEPSEKPKSFMKVICAGVNEQVVGLHVIGKVRTL